MGSIIDCSVLLLVPFLFNNNTKELRFISKIEEVLMYTFFECMALLVLMILAAFLLLAAT